MRTCIKCKENVALPSGLCFNCMTSKAMGSSIKKRNKQSESYLQKECVKWFNLTYKPKGYLLFAIPNGGKRDKITASNMKKEGVVPGVADLCLLVSNSKYCAFFIELKNGRKGVQSKYQKEFEAYCLSNNYLYKIATNFDEFKMIVDEYLI